MPSPPSTNPFSLTDTTAPETDRDQHHDSGAGGEDGGVAHDVVETHEPPGDGAPSHSKQQKHVRPGEFEAEEEWSGGGQGDRARTDQQNDREDRQIDSAEGEEGGDEAYAFGERSGIRIEHGMLSREQALANSKASVGNHSDQRKNCQHGHHHECGFPEIFHAVRILMPELLCHCVGNASAQEDDSRG